MKSRILGLLAVSLMLPVAVSASLTSLTDLFVVGDSYSDGGNGYLVSGGFPPFPPYWDGRFSNGPTAVERLWRLYNPAELFGPSLAGGTNFAIARATTGVENFIGVNPGLPGYANHGAV